MTEVSTVGAGEQQMDPVCRPSIGVKKVTRDRLHLKSCYRPTVLIGDELPKMLE